MVGTPLVFTSDLAAPVAMVGTTEVVVATLAGVVTPFAGQTIKLRGSAMITSGTTTTALTVRIRRASLTGTLIDDQTAQSIDSAAGGTNIYEVLGTDAPGDVTGFTYVLTAQSTGGGTGGTTVYAVLEARVD